MIRRLSSAFAALLWLAAIAGCGSTTRHRVMLGNPGPPHGNQVRIAMEGQPAPPYYEEVALIQAVGKGSHGDLEHVMAGLMQEAAALGCDAIIRVRVDTGGASATATGVAIRLLSGPPTPQPAPPHPSLPPAPP